MTRIAKFAVLAPRDRKFIKAACPGVSIIKIPGIPNFFFDSSSNSPHKAVTVSIGKKLAPIC